MLLHWFYITIMMYSPLEWKPNGPLLRSALLKKTDEYTAEVQATIKVSSLQICLVYQNTLESTDRYQSILSSLLRAKRKLAVPRLKGFWKIIRSFCRVTSF